MLSSTRLFSTSAARHLSIATVPASSSAVSSIKVTVKNAGSKIGPAGLSHVLASSTFLDTTSKSGLRLKRESELLGGEYSAEVTRDSIILKASFLKEGLPFFVNALGSALSEAAYKPHELVEIALPYAHYTSVEANTCPKFKAVEELHAITFRSGLGKPLYFDGTKNFTASDVAHQAKTTFLTENVTIEADNVVESDLKSFVDASPFAKLPTGNDVVDQPTKTYTNGETRIRAAGKTAAVIGLPVSSVESTKSLVHTLLALETPATIDAKTVSYDGASLFYFTAVSEDASAVSDAIKKAVSAAGDSLKGFNYVVVGDIDVAPLKSEL